MTLSSKQRKARNRASILAVLVIFTTLFVLINAQMFILAAFIYIVMGVVGVFFYRAWDGFGRKGKIAGIGDRFFTDIIIGIGLTVLTFVLSNISPIIGTIGIPNVQSITETVGRFLIIVIAAPVMEELIFRDFILDFIDEKFVDIPFFIAALITSVIFSLFHLTAYGPSLSAASGSFFSAALMGMGFAYARKIRKSNTPNIVWHMGMNFMIGFINLGVIIG